MAIAKLAKRLKLVKEALLGVSVWLTSDGGYPWIAFTLSGFTHSKVTVTDKRGHACTFSSLHSKLTVDTH